MGRLFRTVRVIDLVILACISAFSLFILLSTQPNLFWQQFFFLIVGIVIAVIVSHIDAAILFWLAPWGYIASLIFLLISFLGPNIRGSTRWLMIGPVQLQPSEFVKPFILIFFAWAMVKFPPKTLPTIGLHLLLFLLPVLIVFKQPDLGTSIVFTSFWLAMIVAAGLPIRLIVVALIMAILVLPLGWRGLASYQKGRILTFLNPALDPKGAGYNALQAMITVGSGRIFGRGLGFGTQSHLRFLPEFHTDFIFATLVEELGFLGGLLLLASYWLLLWRIVSPLLRGRIIDVFPFVYSVGLFTYLLTQIVINAGMNMGIFPITGITLPLVSYGGSSLLSVFISYGFLWALRSQGYPDRIAYTA